MDLSGVTVVLPALDEAAALPAALGSFPAGVDLLVVDNGSNYTLSLHDALPI